MAGGSTRSSPSKEDAQTHTTPNTRSSPSKEDAQTHTTAAASTSAVSSSQGAAYRIVRASQAQARLRAASAATTAATAATATTATIFGEVGNADPVDDESAEEDHGNGEVGDADPFDESAEEDHDNGEVGDADPVHDESAEEDPIIVSNSYNWIIEGVEELDEEEIRHMNAFYVLLKKWIGRKENTSKIITKEDYNARVNFLLHVKEGNIDCREGFLTGNVNAYKWLKMYHVFKYGDDSEVLVLCPSPKKGAVDVVAMPLNSLQQPTYAERLSSTCGRSARQTIARVLRFFIAFGTNMAT
jgi:hypothetical protein